MVHSCCIVGCSNRQNKEKGISLHRFPKGPLWRREAWTKAVKRLKLGCSINKQESWEPTQSSRICSIHFLTGKPSEDPAHPDFVPTQNLHGCSNGKKQKKSTVERYKRSKTRQTTNKLSTVQLSTDQVLPGEPSDLNMQDAAMALLDLSSQEEPQCTEKGTQCDSEMSEVAQLKRKLCDKSKAVESLQKKTKQQDEKIKALAFSVSNMTDNMFTFYTGLSKQLFLWIFDQIYIYVKKKRQLRGITLQDHFLMVLIKIRLGLLNRDLAFRFAVSESSVSRILNKWIPIVAKCMKQLIIWPERDVARSTIPLSFKPDYNKVISIIDCFEIFTERPQNLTARAQTWSNYKHNNTVKYLISVTPSGGINFLSRGWGGRVSDKEITLKSGYMDKLMHGDEVLADRGFLVTEEMASRGITLRVPSFTRGKKQLSGKEVETSRKLSHVRIHVERVIGRMRNFLILDSIIPVSQVHLLDDIIIIIGALHNLQPSIVKA